MTNRGPGLEGPTFPATTEMPSIPTLTAPNHVLQCSAGGPPLVQQQPPGLTLVRLFGCSGDKPLQIATAQQVFSMTCGTLDYRIYSQVYLQRGP
jgi:hypothetical protein